jgi:hypothetical protein
MGILITVKTHIKIRLHIILITIKITPQRLGHTLRTHHLTGILITVKTHTKVKLNIKNPSFDKYSK